MAAPDSNTLRHAPARCPLFRMVPRAFGASSLIQTAQTTVGKNAPTAIPGLCTPALFNSFRKRGVSWNFGPKVLHK